MNIHLLLEETTIPIRVEATLTIKRDSTGYYSASTMWDRRAGLGATPEGALLDYLQQELERMSFFRKYFEQTNEKLVLPEYQEYTDPVTGMLLIVQRDNPRYPGYPKLTFVCPTTHHLSVEEINGGMARLQEKARIPPEMRDSSPYTNTTR